LSFSNKKDAIRFGTERPFDELVKYLDNSFYSLREHPWGLEQGNNSVEDFYKKYEYIKLSRWDESQNKNQFICELSFANQFKIRLCGLDLPLDELVDRLVKLEA
ncbi:13266_t:CDS:1, partial [Funneliformis geosporum]